MTLIGFIMDYTITIVCKGNRSECARKLSMDYAAMRKHLKRVESGGSSATLVEAILEMYWRERLSMDDALRRYTETRMGEDLEEAKKRCDDLYSGMQNKVRNGAESTRDLAAILKAAEDLGKVIRREYCEKHCNPFKRDGQECAFKRYDAFIDQLKEEMGTTVL